MAGERYRRRRLFVLLAGGLLVLLSACTGADDGAAAEDGAGAGPTEEPTAEASEPATFAEGYRSSAEDYANALEIVQNEGAPAVAEDAVGAHEVYEQLRLVTEAARADFAALQPPSELADEHAGLLDNFAAQIDTLADVVDAARERDDRAVQRGLQDYADLLSVWRERHTELVGQLADA